MSAMSVTHHGRPDARTVDAGLVSPPARRISRRRLHDPRLWVGLLLVAVSVLVGARLLAAADDTVPVWRLADDVQPGDELTPADVDVAHVHFEDAAAATTYLTAEEALPDGLLAERPLAAGELIPAAAVGSGDVTVPRELPLGVTAAGVPGGLGTGDLVDVWAVPPADAPTATSARVLHGVRVAAVSDAGASGIASDRQVVVAVGEGVELGPILDQLRGATVVLVRVGG
jgi:hypothetical protein